MTPERRPYTPRPYAPLAAEHLMRNRRAALWAGMGLGKGVMTMTALSDLDLTDDVFPAIVFGPKRVARDVWPDEIAKWQHLSHLHCEPIMGTAEQRLRAVKRESPVYSINYEMVPWLTEYWGDRWPYRTIVSDESTRLKNYRGSYRTSTLGKVYLQASGGGMRARALSRVAHLIERGRFIELSGTPSPNGLQDLWGQLWYLDKGHRLGLTYEAFKSRWFKPKYGGFGIEPLAHAEAEIYAAISDICLTIDVRDWFDLKEPIVNNIYVDLPASARKHYKDMEKSMFTELKGATVEAFNAAARTQKCLQLANGAVYVDPTVSEDRDRRSKEWRPVHDAKMEALDSVVTEAAEAPMLVSYTFRSDLARILKAYPKAGQAADLATTKGLAAFKAGDVQLGLCHPASLGHGVDGLQDVCNIVTHFSHDWPLDTYDQINARTGNVRQWQAGLDRPTFVNHIIARDTLDEDVMERRTSKATVQECLLNAMKRRLQ